MPHYKWNAASHGFDGRTTVVVSARDYSWRCIVIGISIRPPSLQTSLIFTSLSVNDLQDAPLAFPPYQYPTPSPSPLSSRNALH